MFTSNRIKVIIGIIVKIFPVVHKKERAPELRSNRFISWIAVIPKEYRVLLLKSNAIKFALFLLSIEPYQCSLMTRI